MKRTPLKRKTPLRAKTPMKQKREKPRRKAKRDTVASVRKKINVVFSEYIRRSHADAHGYVRCCSCGLRMHWKDSQAGHYRKRGFGPTCYDERNVHPQCKRCNCFLDGNESAYAAYLVKRYGPDIIVSLYEKSTQPWKWRVTEMREVLQHYKQKLAELDAAT
jgi:hypothetical protein